MNEINNTGKIWEGPWKKGTQGNEELHIENKDRKVKIRTMDAKSVSGYINILGFDRVSDFLLHHTDDFIMLYNGGIKENNTIFVYKKNIVAIEDATD